MHAKRSKRPRTYGGWISVAGQDFAFGTKDCLSIFRVRERMILFYIHTQYQCFTAGEDLRFRTFLEQIPAIFYMRRRFQYHLYKHNLIKQSELLTSKLSLFHI